MTIIDFIEKLRDEVLRQGVSSWEIISAYSHYTPESSKLSKITLKVKSHYCGSDRIYELNIPINASSVYGLKDENNRLRGKLALIERLIKEENV